MNYFLIDKTTMNKFLLFASITFAALLASCSSFAPSGSSARAPMKQAIAPLDKVAMLPVANFTDVPQAGLRVEALLESALRQIGIRQLVTYPSGLNTDVLFESNERKVQAEAEKWASTQGMRYVVSTAVNEWRYKVGVDGEPAVGLMVQIKDLTTGEIVYSAAGGRTGGSREALAAVGLQLVKELIGGVLIESAAGTPATSSSKP